MRIIETARIVILIIRAGVLLYKIGKIGFFTLGDSVASLLIADNTATERGILKIATCGDKTASRHDNIADLRISTVENTARSIGGVRGVDGKEALTD